MADKSDKPQVIDDWDSLPLDSEADDWDDVPLPLAAGIQSPPLAEKKLSEKAPPEKVSPSKASPINAPPIKAIDDSFEAVSNAEPDWSEPVPPEKAEGGNDFGELDESLAPETDEFLDLSPLEAEDDAGSFEAELKAARPDDSFDVVSEPELKVSRPDDSLDAVSKPNLKASRPNDSFDAVSAPKPKASRPDDSFDAVSAPESIPEVEVNEVKESPSAQPPKTSPGPNVPDSSFDIEVLDDKETLDKKSPAPSEKSQSSSASRQEPPREGEPSAATEDQYRDVFLKSLTDSDDAEVPKKVELDLDGIFNEAKKEAENLSPEATHMPEDAPVDPDEPVIAPPIVTPKITSVKVSRFKLIIFIAVIAVALTGLSFGIYEIFLKSPEVVVVPPTPEVIEDDLAKQRVKVPGVFPLERFYIRLGDDPDNMAVVEMEIILHYQDDLVVDVIKNEMVVIRDMIYRLTRSMPSSVLTDADERRQLQANLLSTLNNLDVFYNDPENPVLSYVQISLFKKR